MICAFSKTILFFLFVFGFVPNAFASSAADAETIPICRGTTSTITPNDMDRLFQGHLFPGPFDSMGEFMDKAQLLNQNALKCPRHETVSPMYGMGDVSPKALLAVDGITREVTSLIAHDMKTQHDLMIKGMSCSAQLANLNAAGKSTESVTLQDFKGSSDSSKQECLFFAQKFIPEIKRRYSKMREMLALANPPVVEGKPLALDKPFSDDLTKMFYPSVWKQNTTTDLPPLTESEVKEALELQKKTSPGEAKKTYYQYLSMSPILLFFDNQPKPIDFQRAFTEMQAQSSMDMKDFEKNPPQDIMLMTPYLLNALKETPPEKLGDACVVVHQILKNLTTRYEKFPQMVARFGLAFSLAGGFGAVGAKGFFSAFLTRMGISSQVYGAVVAKDSFTKYAFATGKCSQVAAEETALPANDYDQPLCDFEGADNLYRDGQANVVARAFMGSLMGGVGRFLRPVTP